MRQPAKHPSAMLHAFRPASARRCLAGLCLCLSGLLSLQVANASPQASSLRGLPSVRTYPLEEIGNVPKGARIGFDHAGRLTLTQDNFHSALNDTVWVDRLDRSPNTLTMAVIAQADDGGTYFGARAVWGSTTVTKNGLLRPVSSVPKDCPKWTTLTVFTDLIPMESGVFFAGRYGVVYWDKATDQSSFLELPNFSRIFRAGSQVYASAHDLPLLRLEIANGALRSVPLDILPGAAVEHATSFDEKRALLGLRNGKLLVFDGTGTSPWPARRDSLPEGNIAGVQHLVDGGIAVSITGKGLFLLSPDGTPFLSLTTPQYHRITGLANREPGVLWLVTEEAVEKVFYGSPISFFGQRLGLTVNWPLITRLNDSILVASSGVLYQAVAGTEGRPDRFEPQAKQVPKGAWALAAKNSQLLVGNASGVYTRTPEGDFTQVVSMKDLSQLAMLGDDLCFAIGRSEVVVLARSENQWTEAAPRIPGIECAAIHAAGNCLWIELGTNRIARLSLDQGSLHLRQIDLPWAENQWVNIGIVGDTVVASGSPGERAFFDKMSGNRMENPRLARLLDRSPYWITRIVDDGTGMLWGSHVHGAVLFSPRDGDYEIDSISCDLNNDYYPAVRILEGNDVWFSASKALFHIDRSRLAPLRQPKKPLLVSLLDERAGTELLPRPGGNPPPLGLPFEQNTLSFSFFSGSYAFHRSPEYEYWLDGEDHWTKMDTGKPLRFAGLGDGRHRLDTRIANSSTTASATTSLEFTILPPWHRTWQAYALLSLSLAAAVLLLIRWSSRNSDKKNIALEKLVNERTAQLAATIEQLNDETRNAATLAERARLGGEIHDSIQQGIIGTLIQLDSTLKLPSVSGEVRNRLDVARGMLSFTRNELQHAVWDLESPLLENTELGEALRKLTSLINPGNLAMVLSVTGTPLALPQSIKHHLLRITQEATTNAVRHAKAAHLSISLHYGTDALTLAITDDGMGFDSDKLMTQGLGHFGVRGMRNRALKVQGTLSIQSTPGKGTSITLSMPVPGPGSSSLHANQRPL